MLLTGDPGIGKTRLVAEIARRAHDAGAFVLAGRSPEESLVPYQPFVEALRHYFMTASARELRASAREYGSELMRLVPELRRRAPELSAPIDSEPETERYRLFEAVVGLLTEISATAPVLLVLDDVQWADRPTPAPAPPHRAGARPRPRARARCLPGDRGAFRRASRPPSPSCAASG